MEIVAAFAKNAGRADTHTRVLGERGYEIICRAARFALEQEARCLLNSVIAKATSREALLTAIRDSKTFTEPARHLALQQAPAAWTARQRQQSRE